MSSAFCFQDNFSFVQTPFSSPFPHDTCFFNLMMMHASFSYLILSVSILKHHAWSCCMHGACFILIHYSCSCIKHDICFFLMHGIYTFFAYIIPALVSSLTPVFFLMHDIYCLLMQHHSCSFLKHHTFSPSKNLSLINCFIHYQRLTTLQRRHMLIIRRSTAS